MKSVMATIGFSFALLLAMSNAFAANTSNKTIPDIIKTTLYGTEAELRPILALPEEKFIWKTYQGGSVDSRDVALFYALSCGHLQNVPLLLENRVSWSHNMFGDMPYMEEQCKKKLNSKNVLQSIITIEKEWAEGDVEGDCARGEHIYDVLSSPKALELLLTYDRKLCQYQTQCGESLKQHILNMNGMRSKNYKQFLNVYNKFCK